MSDHNKHLALQMTRMVDNTMTIIRDGVLFEDLPDTAWDKIDEIQQTANALKHKILELEKML